VLRVPEYLDDVVARREAQLFERDLLRERARPAETGTDESKRRKRAP
jgi:hypothetical protein